jgi:dGTPase
MVIGLIEGSSGDQFGMTPDVLEATNELRAYMYNTVYPCDAIGKEIAKAKKLLRELYFHLLEFPAEGSDDGDPEDSLERRTVDFVAGMTDQFALQLYQRIFIPSSGRP